MAKRKTIFYLENIKGVEVASLEIIGERPRNKPYLSIGKCSEQVFIKDSELELFAVNILKALKSKKLKP